MIPPQSIRVRQKVLYIVTKNLCGKLCLTFLITGIPLLIFIIDLSTFCLKFSFSSSKIPRCFCFDVRLEPLEYYWDLWLEEFEVFYLRIALLGLVYWDLDWRGFSNWKPILRLRKDHCWEHRFFRLYLSIKHFKKYSRVLKRDVSSAKIFALVFSFLEKWGNKWGYKWVKEAVPKLNLGELQLELVSMMKFVHLKQPFEIFQKGSFQKDHKVPQRHSQIYAYIANLNTRLC